MRKSYLDVPDYNIREDDDWTSLKDNQSYYWDGSSWVENNSATYTYTADGWKSLNYEIDPDRTFAEIRCLPGSGANNIGSMINGTSSGYAPIEGRQGQIGSFTEPAYLPFTRYFRVSNGDGYYRWPYGKVNGRKFLRFYIQTDVSDYGYNRRLFSFRDSAGNEIVNLSLYLSGSSSTEVENRFLLMNGNNPIAEGSRWVGTREGSMPPAAWHLEASWRRVELMFDPGYGFVINVYSLDGDVPLDSNTWRLADTSLYNIHSVELSEMANSHPELRAFTRIANIGLSNEAWPGHMAPKKFVTNVLNTGNSVLVSTSCPMSSAVAADHYVVAYVAYFDSHSSNAVPNIVPPPGFARLGFTYVGNTGGDTRAFLFVFGRYFAEADSAAKSFSVTGGRTGNWMINERHYLNVNPVDPIAVTWDHTAHLRVPQGTNLYADPPIMTDHIGRGDAVLTSSLSKNDSSTLAALTNIYFEGSVRGEINAPGTTSIRSLAGVLRRTYLHVCDNSHYSTDGLGAPVVRGVATSASVTSSVGRIALRSVENPPVGAFTPYPVPSTIPDL